MTTTIHVGAILLAVVGAAGLLTMLGQLARGAGLAFGSVVQIVILVAMFIPAVMIWAPGVLR